MEKCKEYLKNNFSNGPKAKKILAIATPLFVISVMSICVVANARKTVTINVDGNEQIFVTYKRTIKDALKQVGIELGSKDKVEPALEKKLVKDEVIEVRKLKDIDKINNNFTESEYIAKSYISEVNAETGEVTINLEAPPGLYSEVLKDTIGISVNTKADLLSLFQELNIAKKEYDQIKTALKMVKQTGYGIAAPSLEDMKLEKPEIIKQGSRYGIKLKAKAASIHMIKVEVESTFEPIIGSELQSKELIDHLTKNDNNTDIWKSEIFGRSLDVIVQEGIQAKLSMMPDNVRFKLCQTLTKIINKGSSNMIAIVL